MTEFLIYLLKTTVCLAIFYMFFKVFLSNETIFRFNRKILLFGSIICFALPLVKISISEPYIVQTPFLLLEESLSTEEMKPTTTKSVYGDISVVFNTIEKEATAHKNFVVCLFSIFIAGFLISLIILCKSFFSMYKLFLGSKVVDYEEYRLVLTDKSVPPFSWRNYIIMSTYDFMNSPDEIITHEMAHIKYKHTFDIFLFELFTLLQWFNPVIRLLKKELKYIHEYQADSSVLESGINATKYQLLLVEKVAADNRYALASTFNNSKIKKRINMMLKEKSKSHAKWKLLISVPLLCFVVFMFANPGYYDLPDDLVSTYETTTIQKESMRVNIKTLPMVDVDINDYSVVSGFIPDDSDEPLLNNPVTISMFPKEGAYNITLRFDAYESDEKINEQLNKIDLDNIFTVNVDVPNDATMGLIFKIRQLLINRVENRQIYFIHF